VISVALAAAARGRGLGAKLVAAGTRRFVATTDGRVIHAYIKPDNAASVSAFERAGFSVADDVNMAGAPALHRVWRSS
jgi:L-amino acid N-acyltransferase YncA